MCGWVGCADVDVDALRCVERMVVERTRLICLVGFSVVLYRALKSAWHQPEEQFEQETGSAIPSTHINEAYKSAPGAVCLER